MNSVGGIAELNRKCVLVNAYSCETLPICCHDAHLQKVLRDIVGTKRRIAFRDVNLRVGQCQPEIFGTSAQTDLSEIGTEATPLSFDCVALRAIPSRAIELFALLHISWNHFGGQQPQLTYVMGNVLNLILVELRDRHLCAVNAISNHLDEVLF